MIGAARSGTTWLYQRLVSHPGLFVTPIKELHYFDIHKAYPFWHWIRIRRLVLHLRRYFQYLRNPKRKESTVWLLRWGMRYFLMPKTHRWYCSLFQDEFNRIAGELTPAYSLLTATDVQMVRNISPDVRVVYQMRDPIDRAWSQIVMHLGLHRRADDFTQYMSEIRHVMHRDEIAQRSMYTETISVWEKVFGKEQICYLFFDEILENPTAMLERLFLFLGVAADDAVFDNTIKEKVASRDTGGRGIPSEVEKELAMKFLPMLHELNNKFKNMYTQKWLNRAESAVKQDDTLNSPLAN